MMNAANFPNYFGVQQGRQAAPMDRLVSMLNEKAGTDSPLERAMQALLDAKDRLDQHRDKELEQALDSYRALRVRQTSYESGLEVQQKQLDEFQSLTDRYDALSEELASARADCEACAGSGAPSDMLQDIGPSLRVSTLESELAAADRSISALVDQANRYARGQRQYAAYLKQTGQGGYAAFEYEDQPEYTRKNFASETADMIDRMDAGASQWRERVSSYCGQYDRTPYDFERYLQERSKLSDACFAAQQRLSALLYASDGSAPAEVNSAQAAAPVQKNFDTVEISGVQRAGLPPVE